MRAFVIFFSALILGLVIVFIVITTEEKNITPARAVNTGDKLEQLETARDEKTKYSFVEFDLFTPEELAPNIEARFREAVAEALNKLAGTNEKCNRGVYGAVQKNTDNPANPEFSVSCGNPLKDEKLTRYHFTWMDAMNGKKPYTKATISRQTAIQLCREKSYASVKFPSSARLINISFHDNQDGTAVVAATLKVKNSFDMTVLNEVRCQFDSDKLTNLVIF